jgi:hypothetical protein
LHCGTIGHSFVRVDTLVRLLAVEEVRDEFDDARNTGGTADEHNLVNVGLVNFGVSKDLLDGFEGAAEEVLAKFFEPSTRERGVEVYAVVE